MQISRLPSHLFTDSPIFVGMDEFKEITSVQNPLVRKVLTLRVKSRERRSTGLFVLEGERELQLALKGGYSIDTLFYCPDILQGNGSGEVRKTLELATTCLAVSRAVYAKMAYRGNTQGLLAIGRSRDHALERLVLKGDKPLILVAEAPEKPGNIGALLRTADAAALDAVIIANPKTDLYNPNTIRSSVGCLFTTQVGTGSTAQVISYLKAIKCRMFCAALTASRPYTEIDFKGACAIVVGTESEGLSGEWLQQSDQNIIIPMEGQIDSMNVSVSAAILIFEARRQRRLTA
jgi:TrmH family RNA methyltransferase